jgi:hypothetical protein
MSEPAASGSDQRGTEAHLPWPSPRTFSGSSNREESLRKHDMTSTNVNRFFVPAWGASLALHGTIVGLVSAFRTDCVATVSRRR